MTLQKRQAIKQQLYDIRRKLMVHGKAYKPEELDDLIERGRKLVERLKKFKKRIRKSN